MQSALCLGEEEITTGCKCKNVILFDLNYLKCTLFHVSVYYVGIIADETVKLCKPVCKKYKLNIIFFVSNYFKSAKIITLIKPV